MHPDLAKESCSYLVFSLSTKLKYSPLPMHTHTHACNILSGEVSMPGGMLEGSNAIFSTSRSNKRTPCRKLTLKRGMGAWYVAGAWYVLYGIHAISHIRAKWREIATRDVIAHSVAQQALGVRTRILRPQQVLASRWLYSFTQLIAVNAR